MTRRNLIGTAALLAALGIALVSPSPAPAQASDAKPIKIGLVGNFFNDLPDVLKALVTQPFGEVMKNTTGLDGSLSFDKNAFDTADLLADGKLHFAVFQGHEFAWVQKKNPKLKPLIIAINSSEDVRAYVIVGKNNPAKTMKDLRGKKLDMPKMTKQHCWAYVERHCTDNAQPELKAFFGDVMKSESLFSALDDLCRGKSDAVLVDTIDLKKYRDIKGPVFSKHLRVLQESEMFPPAVLAYKEGVVKDATVKQFRAGLLKAHTIAENNHLFELWNIRSFELPPANFDEVLATSLKAYPPPAAPLKIGTR